MDRTVWIIIAVVALAVAGFFGYRAYENSAQRRADLQHSEELQRALDESRLAAKDSARRADQEAEARRLAELKAKQDGEAEARRLAQAQAEREAQEAARRRAEEEAARSAQEIERMQAERARLEADSRRLDELRTRESAEAEAKLAAAQKALQEIERQKNAEIERQAALIASYAAQGPQAADAKAGRGGPLPRIIFPVDYKRGSHYTLPLLIGEAPAK